MANAVSYEYLKSIQGVPNGISTLDNSGKVPVAQLPTTIVSPFKGQFTDETALTTAFPTANLADYAFVDDTGSFWYWNAGLGADAAWVNQEIEETDYLALSNLAKSMVPYLIVPDTVTTP